MGFEPTISTVTGWHVNRYTTGPRCPGNRRCCRSIFILSGRRKAVNGMPPKRAMDWAQEQIALAVKGQLKAG